MSETKEFFTVYGLETITKTTLDKMSPAGQFQMLKEIEDMIVESERECCKMCGRPLEDDDDH